MAMATQSVSSAPGLHREKIRQCLAALSRMLADGRFTDAEQRIGLEIEFGLVDDALEPSMTNTEVLRELADPALTTELGRHNVELNVPPYELTGTSLQRLENELHHYVDAGLVMIGILPTLRMKHFEPRWMTDDPRYHALNDKIMAVRGEPMRLSIDGVPLPGERPERLEWMADSILPECAGTSVQLHLQVTPEQFGRCFNAAQCLAGPQVAVTANSPFLAGRALWHETRIPLFEQATDTRTAALRRAGVRPRVFFGERWIDSVTDLFDENVRYFPPLLTDVYEQDPERALAIGTPPELHELRVHNSSVWRWNRPVYDVQGGTAHLRIENRVVPSGPSVVDVVANAAFFYGAQLALASAARPVWDELPFTSAEGNFVRAARTGLDAMQFWPSTGWVTAGELLLRVLLPLAREGLSMAGVSGDVAENYLGVIEQRCLRGRTGATWQRDAVAVAESTGADRRQALHTMFAAYLGNMRSGEPVHRWPLP